MGYSGLTSNQSKASASTVNTNSQKLSFLNINFGNSNFTSYPTAQQIGSIIEPKIGLNSTIFAGYINYSGRCTIIGYHYISNISKHYWTALLITFATAKCFRGNDGEYGNVPIG